MEPRAELNHLERIKMFPIRKTNSDCIGHSAHSLFAIFLYFFIISGVGLSPLGTAATSGLLYKPQRVIVEQWWNEDYQLRYSSFMHFDVQYEIL
jgi:hypothetical protein